MSEHEDHNLPVDLWLLRRHGVPLPPKPEPELGDDASEDELFDAYFKAHFPQK